MCISLALLQILASNSNGKMRQLDPDCFVAIQVPVKRTCQEAQKQPRMTLNSWSLIDGASRIHDDEERDSAQQTRSLSLDLGRTRRAWRISTLARPAERGREQRLAAIFDRGRRGTSAYVMECFGGGRFVLVIKSQRVRWVIGRIYIKDVV